MSLVLETHIYSNPSSGFSPWSRSFHLRLSGPSAPKTEILALVTQALARLSRADPVVEGQITLYFTRNGRVASLPGAAAANTTTTTVALPVYQPTVQVLSVDVPTTFQAQQQQPGWPLALTYAGGVNYLHSYSPSPTTLLTSGTVRTQMIVGGSQLSFLNVGIPNISLTCSPRPVVSDVVREVRLDTVAEDALAGLLEWAAGPTGLKLILVVDVDGRDVVPPVVTLPPPSLPVTPPVVPSVAPSVVSGTGTPPAPPEPEPEPEPPAPASPEPPAASA
ncbi:hypothetical protein CSOJ01_07192 [Colletotrichum sojae]|uniref:Uncharacterized protein n=1 Tax=Colletotrichum sojae TaxID=2175907 RepID=A0A8H6JAB8_9PEZI|nr:hypothetical protein CSOJ01_07192 [Colletotrichum sojae]